MSLSRLNIDAVRNLHSVRLAGLAATNVFYGENGSGKTSILEAIHLLGMARSFRGNSVKSLINHDASQCTVFGEVVGVSYVGNWLKSFEEFPPRQKPGSFSLNNVMEKIQEGSPQ